jgi:ketosteroid isomerase-like protein
MFWDAWFLDEHLVMRRSAALPVAMLLMTALSFHVPAAAGVADAREFVARLDTQFQAAVKVNDVQAMDRILARNMVLVLGDGSIHPRAELLHEARDRTYVYERQEEDRGTQSVHVWGDTAVVTARLWVKGLNQGKEFDRHLWFSDVYVRTAKGWHYVFGQASRPLSD